MELLSMKCPNCAGEINYKHGKTSCKCPYCDSVIKISMSAEDLDYEQMMRDSAAAENAKLTLFVDGQEVAPASVEYTTLSGIPVTAPQAGQILIQTVTFADGTVENKTVIIK